MVLLICRSSLTMISYFFLILDNFQNAYVTLNIHISTKWQPKIKTNISNFKLDHWQFKHFIFEKSSFVVHFTLDRTGVCFLGHLVYVKIMRNWWNYNGMKKNSIPVSGIRIKIPFENSIEMSLTHVNSR